mgnify:CR=1 FL=1
MKNTLKSGGLELVATRKSFRPLFWAVGAFSVFANLLMLTSPLYMMLVYDKVLGSRSEATLVALTLLMSFLFLVMGALDLSRGRIMARIGASFQQKLERRVYYASLRGAATNPNCRTSQAALSDLEAVQKMLASPGLMALFDLPWVPVFLLGIFIFQPALGILALAGGGILIVLALVNQKVSRTPAVSALQAVQRADRLGSQLRDEAEMLQSLGMRGASYIRWRAKREEALALQVSSGDIAGSFSSVTKTFRVFLQSAMLGLGAYLVLQGQMSAGAMIAGSVMMGRALAPLELAIGQWPVVQRGLQGWRNLGSLLTDNPAEPDRTKLPRPEGSVFFDQVTVSPPGSRQMTLRGVSFKMQPGQVLGVIGPSGAGKSTLARVLTGAWSPVGGKVHLGGAPLDQYDPDALGGYIGYLPQRVQLFDGTIAQNIARLSQSPDSERVVQAAREADAHNMIMSLPNGYDTQVSQIGGKLSGGQIQRIGLARALYGNPVLLVLDEPNSNLDNEGSEAVNIAIRHMKSSGQSVVIIAHRPSAIQECDLILILDKGRARAFGDKNSVLRGNVSNHEQIARSTTAAGGIS